MKMREGWVSTTLGVVAQRTVGRTPPRKEAKYWTDDTRMPFCTIKSMQNRTKMEFSEGVTKQAVEDSVARLAPEGALLLSFKLSIGRVRFAPRNLYFNEAIAWVRPDESVVGKRFLALALEDVDWDSLGARAVKGKTLNAQSLDSVPLAIPPLDEQRRIVDLMNSVDAAISAAQAEVDAGVELRERLLDQELGNPADDWEQTTLGEIAEWHSGATPKATNRAFYDGGSIPWAKIGDVNNGEIAETEVMITASGLREIGRTAPVGSVLVTMYGSIGRSALVKREMATNQAITWGVPKGSVSSEFLFLLTQSSEKRFDSLGRGATQRNINRKIVKDLPVDLPPQAEQQRIVTKMALIDSAVTSARTALDRLRELRSSMLTVLLSGDHEIPESYDRFLTDTAEVQAG